jgi:hypothetical protein
LTQAFGRLGDLGAAHREEGEPQGVGEEEKLDRRLVGAGIEHSGGGGRQDHRQLQRVAHPEDGEAAKEQVAQCAAADGGDHGDDADTEEVEPLAPRRQGAADREDGDAGQVEEAQEGQVEEGHGGEV